MPPVPLQILTALAQIAPDVYGWLLLMQQGGAAIASDPLHVTTGFTWTAAGAWSTFLALLVIIIRQVGPWHKQTTEASDNLINQLSERLDKVERQLAAERRLHFIEIRRLEARNAAQRALDRHKFNNREQCLDALLRILEMSPEKAQEAARQARQQISEQRKGEQLEAATIHKAEMVAVEIAERELSETEDLL